MSTVPFEARYLDVTWLDRDTVQHLSASIEPIPVSEEEGAWHIDTHVFKAHRLRLGFRMLDEGLAHPPCFLVEKDAREELLAFVDPGTGDTWWIENSGWDAERRRYHSRLQRTVGTARVWLQDRLLTVHNHSLNFTSDELDAYLSDFKSDLWLLIFDPRGTVHGRLESGTPNILGQELLRRTREFVGAAENIAARMEVELKEVVEQRPLRSVRPISATFKEVAMRSHARQLSSRGFAEARDTAANRYAHHLVNKLKFMVAQLRRTALAQTSGLKNMADRHLSWPAELESRTWKPVDPEVLHSELARLEAQLDAARNAVEAQDISYRLPGAGPEEGYTFKLRPARGQGNERFYCLELDGEDFGEKFETYCIVTLPKPIAEHVAGLVQNGRRRIRLAGALTKSVGTDKNNQKFFRINYEYVERIEFLYPTAVDDMRKRFQELSANDWRLPLTSRERQEFRQESKALAARAATLAAHVSGLGQGLDALDLVERRLNKVRRTFAALKVGASSKLPQSMTYVRNPDYFALKAAYDRLNSLAGAGDDVLDAMMDVEDIGLVNVSNLYEKWCLLQMIKVLRDGFGFEPEDGWQKNLVSGVLGRARNISLAFKGPAGWTATLVHEKVLANNRRPDFVFDLSVPCYEQTEEEPRQWFDTGTSTTMRFVMDAKFRERWRPAELAELLEELCVRKNYAEGGRNPVFILHPCAELGQPRTSPLSWGRSSDYGQLHDHRRGAIHLSPRCVDGPSIDNLHRLFGMIFQEASQFLRSGDGWKWTDALCIGCGRGIGTAEVRLKYGTTRTSKERWELECRACQLVTVRTNCYECGRVIFKNGHHWTYHRTRAESRSNIVCPHCERFFDNPSDEAS